MSRKDTLPAAVDAEDALLGSLILSTQACMEVIDDEDLQVSEFYSPANAEVFEAIRAIWVEGSGVDPITVHAALTRSGSSVTLQRLLELQNATPSVAGARRYCAELREKALLRRLVSIGSDLASAAMSGERDSGALIADLTRAAEDASATAETLGGEVSGLYLKASDVIPDGQSIENTNPWTVPLLARKEEAVIIVAGGGSGKSTLLRQIGYTAENSVHWCSGIPMDFPPQRCLVIEAEARKHNVAQSAGMLKYALAKQLHTTAAKVREPAVLMRPAGFDIRNSRDRAMVISAIRQVKPDIVCIGPLKNIHTIRPGEQYEVAAVETQKVLAHMMEKYGFSIIMETHSNKSDPGRVAGSERWSDWPDIGFSMMTDDKDAPTHAEMIFDVMRFRMDRNPQAHLPKTLVRNHMGEHMPWICQFTERLDFKDRLAELGV